MKTPQNLFKKQEKSLPFFPLSLDLSCGFHLLLTLCFLEPKDTYRVSSELPRCPGVCPATWCTRYAHLTSSLAVSVSRPLSAQWLCTLDGSGEQETNNQWKVGGNVGIAKLLLTLYALLSLWTSLLKHKFKDRIIKNFKRWQQSINLQVWVPFLILELHSWASSFMSLISSLRPSLGGGGLRIDS